MISSFIKSLVINPFILFETISFIDPLFIVKTGTPHAFASIAISPKVSNSDV